MNNVQPIGDEIAYTLDLPALPIDVMTEQMLIGALMADNAAYAAVAQIAQPDDLTDQLCRELMELIAQKYDKAQPFTAVALSTAWTGENAEQARHAMVQMQRHAMPAFVKSYAETVRDLSARRKLIEATDAARTRLMEDHHDSDVADIASDLASDIDQAVQNGKSSAKTVGQVMEQIWHNVKVGLPTTPTGIALLDKAMGGGLEQGRAYAFVARPKVGKTILAGSISHNLNQFGAKHLFIAGEMGSAAIHERALSREMGINSLAFRNKEERQALGFQERLATAERNTCDHVIYEDAPFCDLSKLKRMIASAVHRHKIEGFILDYMQLVTGQRRNESQAQHYEQVANWIAAVVKQHGLWAIVILQANQEGSTLGGEGPRRAFDQSYRLEQVDQISRKVAYLEMYESRYTPPMDVGTEDAPALLLDMAGPHYRTINPDER